MRRWLHYVRLGKYKWFAPVLGAIIILSPLPDEFGLALLGFSKLKIWVVLLLAFVLNAIGIYALLLTMSSI
ncbi:MAG: hypothetical protein RIQ56_694, partial [Candidatus Parcubacteria bacterium]